MVTWGDIGRYHRPGRFRNRSVCWNMDRDSKGKRGNAPAKKSNCRGASVVVWTADTEQPCDDDRTLFVTTSGARRMRPKRSGHYATPTPVDGKGCLDKADGKHAAPA